MNEITLTDLLVNSICFQMSTGTEVSIDSFDKDLLKILKENYIDVEDLIEDIKS